MTKKELLAAAQRHGRVVELPELDGLPIKIKTLSARRAMEFQAIAQKAKDGDESDDQSIPILAGIVAEVILDPENGKPIFKPEDADEIIDAFGIGAILKIFELAVKVDVEAAAKN